MAIYWQGTKFDKMFSKNTMMIVFLMAVFDIVVHSVSIYHLKVTENIDSDNKKKLSNLITTNILNQVSVYLRYYFIGLRLPCYTIFD